MAFYRVFIIAVIYHLKFYNNNIWSSWSPTVLTKITPQLSHWFTWMAMFNWEQRMCKEQKTQVQRGQLYKLQINKNCCSVFFHSLYTSINIFPISWVLALLICRVADTSVNFGLFEVQIHFVLHITLPKHISADNLQSNRHLSISVLYPTKCCARFADT